MIGERYGLLVVIDKGTLKNTDGTIKWLCHCDCGNLKEVSRANLVKLKNSTKSCGCLLQKHGYTGTPEYQSWTAMRRRCQSPKDIRYANYGGRGIKVCERWSIFLNFLEDIGIRPSAFHSLDRIDNEGNYEPDNVKWSLPAEQMNNRTNTRFLTYGGQTKSLQEWCKLLNLNSKTVSTRICRGWSVEAAFDVI
jgi:hypothetical protein